MRLEKFTHPMIGKLHIFDEYTAKLELDRINKLIFEKFKQCEDYGYKQIEFTDEFHVYKEKSIFVKKEGRYKFYFDVKSLELGLSFNYLKRNSLLLFKSYGKNYSEVVLDYKFPIKYFTDISIMELKLKSKFLVEVNDIFFNNKRNKNE